MKIILTCTTTFNRLDIFSTAIQSLLSQSLTADLFVVNLAEDEFEPMGKNKIPQWLIHPRITIQLTKDTGSYKKLIPSFHFANAHDLLITADDDEIYHERWLENLVNTSKANPDYIICTRARQMKKNIFNNWTNYRSWKNVRTEQTSLYLIPIGVGGVVYQKRLLDMEFLLNNDYMKIAPGTDDLWFKMGSFRKNVPVMAIPSNSAHNISIEHDKGLRRLNLRSRKDNFLFRGICNYLGINLNRNDENWDAILAVGEELKVNRD
jgi:hypothetical protein